jgi:hypothetical protein
VAIRPQLAAAALLAAGGAAAGGFYLWPTGRHLAGCPPLHAPVPAEAKAALAAYAGRIRFDRDRSKDGSLDVSWYDSLTGRSRQVAFDPGGRITDEFGDMPDGKFVRNVWVMYDGREWISDRQRLPSGLPGRAAEPASLAQANRDKVFRGKATVVGRELVDGRVTLHLREIVHVPAFDPARLKLPKGAPVAKRFFQAHHFRVDTWVDPLTYLPVRTRSPGSTSDEAWLPRTDANIAKTKIVVPRGFRRAVEQRGTGFNTLVSVSKTKRCTQS